MMPTAHFGELTAQQPSLVFDTPRPAFAGLGNQRAQEPNLANVAAEPVWFLDFLNKRSSVTVRPTSRLAILKREKFTVEGRAQRIKHSLDALNAPDPIQLTLEQWKEVIAEAEEDDEDQ